MQDFVVRKLHIDLSQGFDRFWNGDAFMTAFFNTLSMSFPIGEQFFIDSVKAGLENLPNTEANQSLREAAQTFIGQEATHRYLHKIYNQHLQDQGYKNHWESRTIARLVDLDRRLEHSPRPYLHRLAITAAYEHFTAILGRQVLGQLDQKQDWLKGADPTMKLLWRWHASEEVEHRSVAFDLYVALGGNYKHRIKWFSIVLMRTYFDITVQTFNNLWHDGSLLKRSTWWSALKFYAGPNGLLFNVTAQCFQYFRKKFHPHQDMDVALAYQWLQDNQPRWSAVRSPKTSH